MKHCDERVGFARAGRTPNNDQLLFSACPNSFNLAWICVHTRVFAYDAWGGHPEYDQPGGSILPSPVLWQRLMERAD